MKLTNEQLKAIENIEAATRYEAMENVAEILNAKTYYVQYGKAEKKIDFSEELVADISFQKGKVRRVTITSKKSTREFCIRNEYILKKGTWTFFDFSWDRR